MAVPTCTMCNIRKTVKILVRSMTIEKKVVSDLAKNRQFGSMVVTDHELGTKKSELVYCGFCGPAKPKPISVKAQNFFQP